MLMLFIFKEQLVTVAVGANLVVCEHYVTVVPGSEKAAILCECTESVRWMSRRKWIHPLIGPCGPFGPFVHIRCSSCLLTQYAPLLSSQFLAEETSTDTSETTHQPRLTASGESVMLRNVVDVVAVPLGVLRHRRHQHGRGNHRHGNQHHSRWGDHCEFAFSPIWSSMTLVWQTFSRLCFIGREIWIRLWDGVGIVLTRADRAHHWACLFKFWFWF